MRKFDYIIVAFFIGTIVSYFLIQQFSNKSRIAYVRSQELVYGYEGTKEAVSKFNNEKQKLLANVDTLKADFQRDIARYNNQYTALTKVEIKEYEERLANKEKQLTTYTDAINNKIKSKDDKMMQAVLNQINGFVEQYAKQKGYSIILGTTLSGSVLYGDEDKDITDEILKALNENYKGS